MKLSRRFAATRTRLSLVAMFVASTGYADPPVAPAAPPCEQAKVDNTIEKIKGLIAKTEIDAKEIAECKDALVLCLDYRGRPLKGESLPPPLSVGETLSISIIVAPSFDTTMRILATGQSRLDTLFEQTPPQSPAVAPAAAAPPAPACPLTPGQMEQLKKADQGITVLRNRGHWHDKAKYAQTPTGASLDLWEDYVQSLAAPFSDPAQPYKEVDTQSITIPDKDYLLVDIRRVADDEKSDASVRTFDLLINHGRYYADVSVLIPVVFNGKRTYYTSAVPGTGDQRIALEHDHLVSSAVMLNLYPFGGRARNNIWFANEPGWRKLSSLLGLQAGTSISSPAKEWYAGLIIEPVSGIGLGVGGALVQAQYLPSGYTTGMLLSPGQQPNARETYSPRFYAGATLSLEVLNTINSVKTSATSP